MIKTNTNELNGKFIITDDVNSENIEFIKNHYNKSILKIDKRFDIPQTGYELISIAGSNTFREIESALETVYSLLQNGGTTIVNSETTFNNFKTKVNYWCNIQFREVITKLDAKENTYVIIHNDISKHEYTFLYWLFTQGVNVVVITKNINKAGKISDDVQLNIFNTNENLEYRTEVLETKVEIVKENDIKSIKDIETALYEKNSVIKVICSGVDNYIDTCDFYGKIYIESETGQQIKLYINEIENPTQEEVSKIPRFKKDEHNYILQTLLMFVNVNDKDKSNKLKEAIQAEFNRGQNKELKGSILYNKLLYTIVTLNRLINSEIKHLVMFCNKNLGKNDICVLRVLANLDLVSILLLFPNKKVVPTELDDKLFKLEMESSIEMDEIPKVDSRNNVKTTGAVASRIAQETLYNGELLGMYKPGQFCTCETKLFSTAYEEISLWWNKELYNRPQFKAEGVKVNLPVIFKVINGLPDNYSHAHYLYNTELVSKYLYGNTILCKRIISLDLLWGGGQTRILRATDINGTDFKDQKPFYNNGKLDKQRIKRGINYKYGFLSIQKQDFILNKIEEILNTDYIDYPDKITYIDTVLNILLNLDNELIKIIQWFEFYTDNPNLVLVMPDESMLKLEDIILIMFLHIIGFDILIFVPTCYRSIEGLVTSKFCYDEHNIGYAVYDINTDNLVVGAENSSVIQNRDPDKKKKGFFSKLFGG